MTEKLDPGKAIYLKPNQRRLPQAAPTDGLETTAPTDGMGQWVDHPFDCALDAWGTAIRDMKKAGTWPE
jgi:hypothetical protein